MSRNKKYFTLFGIMAATIDRKISSMISSITQLVMNDIPKITKQLMAKELKPINLYSTNKNN